MIVNAALQTIFETATDISMTAEIYSSDAVPGADGFDPVDALDCFAAVSGINFRSQNYKQLVTQFGRVRKNTNGEVGTTTVTFNNTSREIANFEFNQGGFEGLILVIRTLSRSQSIALTDTKIEFVGRCDKPDDGDKESIAISAKSMTGSIEVMIPRRKFGPDDLEGRAPTDPEFEGFINMPSYGSIEYARVEKRGGFFGWFNKKWVRHTLSYSSYSLFDANKVVPEVFGRAQLLGVLMAAADVGFDIYTRYAFAEGEIAAFENLRSLDPLLPIDVNDGEILGKVGVLNVDNPTWISPGYYSRTAYTRIQFNGSTVEDNDPAPELAAVIKGRIMQTPNTSNVWSGSNWNENAAAHVRNLYINEHYYNLDPAWMDDDEFGDCYWFNDELIWNAEFSDFTFVEPG